MLKNNRNYRIKFEVGELKDLYTRVPTATVEIAYPLTIDFDITRGVYTKVNTMQAQIRGLGETTRTLIYKDRYDFKKYVNMEFYAGYGEVMPLIFKGDFKECYSHRKSGGTEFVTEVTAWDGGFAIQNGTSAVTFDKGTDPSTVLTYLAGDLPNVTLGAIQTPTVAKTQRGNTFLGRTWDLLDTITDGNLFIDNETIHFLNDDGVIGGDLYLIDSTTGLLGSPRRADTRLEVDLLFEPQLKIGQLVALNSLTLPYLNQTYKVLGLRHNGVISGAINGGLVTTVTLYLGTGLFTFVGGPTP